METKHTPLPWHIKDQNVGGDKYHYIQQKGKFIGFVMGITDKADAEFIVRACNSHYELLEAAKAALGDGSDLRPHVLEKLKKAISKAEGK